MGAPRLYGGAIEKRHIKIAHASQKALEKVYFGARHTVTSKNWVAEFWCIAGGVGLNCSANSMLHDVPFLDEIFVQPASSDRGLPLGSALIGQREYDEKFVVPKNIFLGPTYGSDDYLDALKDSGRAL